ncbi:uncharacterized protein [Aegilops tauschii subsp. strangulata]|uniref:Uncharacterized protein n=2 Tax=Aegilops tauschii TaxID=37682 RepID=A0A453DNU2_AEGTS|nr:uncharacterized protein LOC109738498 [Aegilops tauschii subsp. strangulata]
MARLLLFAADHTAGAPGAATLVLVILVVLVVAAVVVSLCTSSTHEKLWGQQCGSSSSAPLAKADSSVGSSNRKHLLSATLSGIGGKAARMVSWNRRSPSGSSDDDEEAVAAVGLDDDDEAIWRKAIIMGDKCRPLQFSGHIAFDSDGNQLPPPPAAVKKASPDVPAKN